MASEFKALQLRLRSLRLLSIGPQIRSQKKRKSAGIGMPKLQEVSTSLLMYNLMTRSYSNRSLVPLLYGSIKIISLVDLCVLAT
uniref:Uncharacterized protein n=1 Tax=Parascaris univalens TaxID=6257 RepID=A0A915AH25_PARUN